MSKTKIKKIGDVVMTTLLYIFLAICVFSVFMTVSSKKDSDGTAEIFGYQMRIVVSDSMAKSEHTDVSNCDIKSIPIRSMILVEVMPDDEKEAEAWYRSLKVGDVLTFRYVYSTQITITHRITSITEKEGGFVIELEGDNKSSTDGQLYQTIDTSIPNNTNYVIGKVVGKAYLIGLIVSLLMQPVGMVLIIVIPCFIIILLEALKIVNVLGAEKRERERDENEKKERELAELRRKIKELEKEREANLVNSSDTQGGDEE